MKEKTLCGYCATRKFKGCGARIFAKNSNFVKEGTSLYTYKATQIRGEQFDADEIKVRDEQGLFEVIAVFAKQEYMPRQDEDTRKRNTRGNVMATETFGREIVTQFELATRDRWLLWEQDDYVMKCKSDFQTILA